MRPKRAASPFEPLVLCVAALICLGHPVGGLALAQSDSTGTLVIRITGVASGNARLRIAVFNSEKSWPDDASAVYKTVLDAADPEHEWRIQNVPAGEYAIAVFHDKNGDGKLNRNFLGIPSEPYGFSNNARGSLGPARWNDAKFVVATGTNELEIKIK